MTGFASLLLVGCADEGPKVKGPQARFDSLRWRQAENGNSEIRKAMVRDLLRRHKLVGMSRANIDALLGPPTRTSKFRGYDYVYWLGRDDSYMPIDSSWLGIRFAGDRVSEAAYVQD